MEACRDGLGVSLRVGEAGRVGVDEGDLDAGVAEGVAQENVADGGGAEFAAAGADEDDLHGVVAGGEVGGAGDVSRSARRTVRTPAAMDTPRRSAPTPGLPVSRQPTPRRLP